MRRLTVMALCMIFAQLAFSQTKANNRNNGRSNKDNCCNDGIVAPIGEDQIELNIQSQWFDINNKAIENPVNKLDVKSKSYKGKIYTSNGRLLRKEEVIIEDGKVMFSPKRLLPGHYYIEIKSYRSGFTIE